MSSLRFWTYHPVSDTEIAHDLGLYGTVLLIKTRAPAAGRYLTVYYAEREAAGALSAELPELYPGAVAGGEAADWPFTAPDPTWYVYEMTVERGAPALWGTVMDILGTRDYWGRVGPIYWAREPMLWAREGGWENIGLFAAPREVAAEFFAARAAQNSPGGFRAVAPCQVEEYWDFVKRETAAAAGPPAGSGRGPTWARPRCPWYRPERE